MKIRGIDYVSRTPSLFAYEALGAGCRVWGSGSGVQELGCGVQGLGGWGGFGVLGLGGCGGFAVIGFGDWGIGVGAWRRSAWK